MKKITLALVGALFIAASAPSAFAQSYERGYGYEHGHDRRDEARHELARMQARLDRVMAERAELRDHMRDARRVGDRPRMEHLIERLRMKEREEAMLERGVRERRRELDRMGR